MNTTRSANLSLSWLAVPPWHGDTNDVEKAMIITIAVDLPSDECGTSGRCRSYMRWGDPVGPSGSRRRRWRRWSKVSSRSLKMGICGIGG